MKAKWILVVCVTSFLALLLTNADIFVKSDEFYYFHTAKTIVDKGSFVTDEKPIYWDYAAPWTKGFYNDNYISVTSPGTALLNVPALFASKVVGNTIDFHNDYFIEYNGHTIFDGIFLLVNSTIFFFGSLWLTYKIMLRLNFSRRIGLFSIVTVVISSYALWYVILLPMFTHVYEMFFVALLIYSTLLQIDKPSRRNLALLGVGMGFLFLIRPIFATVILISWIVLLLKTKQFGWKHLAKQTVGIFLSSLPFLILYLIYNYQSYGNALASGYAVTGSSDFDFSTFNGLNILFSLDKGWLVFSPIIIFSLIGLIMYFKRDRGISLYFLLSIFSVIAIYGFWPSWWGGGSYGSRFIIFAVPICTIGLAYFLNSIRKVRLKKIVIFISVLFTVYSGSILLLYRVTGSNSDFAYPLSYFEKQIEIARNSSSIKDYLTTNVANLQGGSSFVALVLGRMDYVLKPEIIENKLTFRYFEPPFAKKASEFAEALLVDKQNQVVYKLEINSDLDDLPVINLENIKLEVVDLTFVDGSKFVGEIVNSDYDFYLEIRKNLILRGEPKLVELSTNTIKIF